LQIDKTYASAPTFHSSATFFFEKCCTLFCSRLHYLVNMCSVPMTLRGASMSIDRLIRLVSRGEASIWFQPRTPEQSSRFGPAEQAQAAMPRQQRPIGESGTLKIAIRLRYNGRERTTELPLPQDVLRQLLSQAEAQQTSIGEFVGDLLLRVMKKDLFRQVVDKHTTNALDEGGRVLCR
jgi:hypothetical protein